MPAWLTLLLIVLVMVALFGDLRRNSGQELSDLGGREDLTIARPEARPSDYAPEAGHRKAA